MNRITWENFGTIEVPCRDGRLLCSPRNPEQEARHWLEQINLRSDDRDIVVVGLGAGHHVRILAASNPLLRVCVVELNAELRQRFLPPASVRVLDPDSEIQKIDYVVGFRPAWQAMEKDYLQVYVKLSQISRPAAQEAAEKAGLVLTAQRIQSLPDQVHFSLKALDFLEEDSAQQEVKIWRCLRELVK